jgi:hypothetical protein
VLAVFERVVEEVARARPAFLAAAGLLVRVRGRGEAGVVGVVHALGCGYAKGYLIAANYNLIYQRLVLEAQSRSMNLSTSKMRGGRSSNKGRGVYSMFKS